jgi:flagellar protein FlaG
MAMEQLNSHLQQSNSELQFQVDSETGHTIYKVVNPGNGQVLLQVPSEEVLAMARNLRAMEKEMSASGVLMDKEG